jgi:hypothetical protein
MDSTINIHTLRAGQRYSTRHRITNITYSTNNKPCAEPTCRTANGFPQIYFRGIAINNRIKKETPSIKAMTRRRPSVVCNNWNILLKEHRKRAVIEYGNLLVHVFYHVRYRTKAIHFPSGDQLGTLMLPCRGSALMDLGGQTSYPNHRRSVVPAGCHLYKNNALNASKRYREIGRC